MITWQGIKSWLLMKAISLAKNRQGLVRVLRTITVKGTTFTRPYWIRPDEVKDNDMVVGGFRNLPKGHRMKPDNIAPNAKVPQEIRDIVTAYQESYLKTRPDKKSADVAFFDDLKANGISWDEHLMPLINMMRAKMAVNIEVMAGWKPPGVDKSLMDKAKQYIRQNTATPQPHITGTSSPSVNTPPVTITLPPKAKTASQLSKDKTKAFYKSFTDDKDFLDALKGMGIEWKENVHDRINMMRAKEALALHIESGFDPVEAFNILNTPSTTNSVVDDTNSDTTVPPTQVDDTPVDIPPKDESLLDIPDNATSAQIEIIKYINKMTELKDIRNCALMGIVPEDDISKDYIINTMIPKLYDWIYRGMVTGFATSKKSKDQFSRGKQAPSAVAKSFQEDCAILGIDLSQYASDEDYFSLTKDLGTYLDIPEKSRFAVLSIINRLFSGYSTSKDRVDLNADAFARPNDTVIYSQGANHISNLNSAFSNYVSDNPDEPSNLGYTGNDLARCKKQFDLNKEGFVRYLNKVKDTDPTNTELKTAVDNSINLYKEIMESLNYNHNLLPIVLRSSSWDKDEKPWSDDFKLGSAANDIYSVNKQLKLAETQSNDVINTLVKNGYSDEDIMAALVDFHRNDDTISSIYVPSSQTRVTIDTSLVGSDKEWSTYSLLYTLIKFQKMRGIYGTPLGEKYLSTYRTSSTYQVQNSAFHSMAGVLYDSIQRGSQDTPEVLVDYMEYLKQLSELPIENVVKAKEAGAKLFGRNYTTLPQNTQNANAITRFYTFESSLPDSEHTVLSNIVYASEQHRTNEILAKKIKDMSYADPLDYSQVFKYYSGNLMKDFKGRLTQYGNKARGNSTPAMYTGKELEDQIQRQLDNATVYSQDYTIKMKDYYESQSALKHQTVYHLTSKDTIYSNKGGIKAAMNKPGRDVFFNIISSIVSNIPGMEDTSKQSLAINLGYEPFNPADPSKSQLNPKKPKKAKTNVVAPTLPPPEPTPEELKIARQQLLDRAMGTIVAENDTNNAKMIDEFNRRFDYQPGEKTLEGTVVNNGVHQRKDSSGNYEWGSRVAIFNSRFFAIKNTTMWEDRFKQEQQRMKDLGLDEDCYKELDLFHGCSRSCVGGILGRSQGWFMGNEYEAAGKMLGLGAYFGLTGGKSSVYCGDNPYSMEHYGELAPDSADGTFILAKVMRGENPKHVTTNSAKWDVRDSKYTSASMDMGIGTLNDCEIAIRNNALILPHHFVDVSCRIVGRNIDQDSNGNFVDDKGNILANKNGVSVGLQQHLDNNPI